MKCKIYLSLCILFSFQAITTMNYIEDSGIETDDKITLPNDDFFFQSPKQVAVQEIIECSGNLIFENEQGYFKRYEFKNLPPQTKITLFQALINRDGYTYKTKNSLLFKQWIQKENWADEQYIFCNVPLQFITSSNHICGEKTELKFLIDPYQQEILSFYPSDSKLQVNCNKSIHISNFTFGIISEMYTTDFDPSHFEDIHITIQNLNDQNELISIFAQLEKINCIDYITKITINKTLLIDDSLIHEIVPYLTKLKYVKYANSDNKIRIIRPKNTV